MPPSWPNRDMLPKDLRTPSFEVSFRVSSGRLPVFPNLRSDVEGSPLRFFQLRPSGLKELGHWSDPVGPRPGDAYEVGYPLCRYVLVFPPSMRLWHQGNPPCFFPKNGKNSCLDESIRPKFNSGA